MRTIFILLAVFFILGIKAQEKYRLEKTHFRYNQNKAILYNKDYKLKCVKFEHNYKSTRRNEKRYLKGQNSKNTYKDIYLKKYIIVRDMNTGLHHAVEYWTRKNKSTLIVLVKLNVK